MLGSIELRKIWKAISKFGIEKLRNQLNQVGIEFTLRKILLNGGTQIQARPTFSRNDKR
jgi:hypothetical protein